MAQARVGRSAGSVFKSVVVDCTVLSGCGMVIYGVWLMHHPTALVVAGVLLSLIGLRKAARE